MRLDQELVRRELASTRSEARRLVEAGSVEVRGVPTPKPATLVSRDTPIEMVAPGPRYVGRGALKLEGALDAFPIDVVGVRALDVGASTGGFTEVLLSRGAAEVVALDVGYGQLDTRLRSDSRVVVMERTNLRHATPADTGGRFRLIVGDLSFISLCAVAGALAGLAEDDADLVLLIKPQFEAGRGEVGRGGVVRDPDVRRLAIRKAVACLDEAGLGAQELVNSPIAGADGNREVFAWCQVGPARSPTLSVPE